MQKANLKLNGRDWQVYLRDEADQSVFNEIFKFKEYRSADEVIKNAKHPVVDAGAHAGFFTMYCRALNKKVKIYAVEPEPNNLKALQRHLDENKILGVKVIAGALAGQSGERKLFLSDDSHNHLLTPPNPPLKKGGINEPPLFKAGAGGGQLGVIAFSFPDFCRQNKIKKISLLKMDIEGGEYELFESFSEADLSVVNFVILEYHISNKFVSRASYKQSLKLRRASKEENLFSSFLTHSNYKQIEEKLRASGFGVQVFPSHFDKTMGFIWANNKRTKY